MKINKSSLDEMQREKRDSIGNQMFILMFYALLLDTGLYGMGIRWLNYPANTMVIIMICMIIYLVRTIMGNAYLPPKAKGREGVVPIIAAIALSVVFAVAALNFIGRLSSQNAVESSKDNSALILFFVAAVGLIISLIAAIIRKTSDNSDSDD